MADIYRTTAPEIRLFNFAHVKVELTRRVSDCAFFHGILRYFSRSFLASPEGHCPLWVPS